MSKLTSVSVFSGDPDALSEAVYRQIYSRLTGELSGSLRVQTGQADSISESMAFTSLTPSAKSEDFAAGLAKYNKTRMVRVHGPSMSGKTVLVDEIIPKFVNGIFSFKAAHHSTLHIVVSVLEDSQGDRHTGKASKWTDLTHRAVTKLALSDLIPAIDKKRHDDVKCLGAGSKINNRSRGVQDCTRCSTFTLERRIDGYVDSEGKCVKYLVDDPKIATRLIMHARDAATYGDNTIHEGSSRGYTTVRFVSRPSDDRYVADSLGALVWPSPHRTQSGAD